MSKRLRPFVPHPVGPMLFVFAALAVSVAPIARAQDAAPSSSGQNAPSSQQQQQTAPSEGGPNGDNGAIAIPKKNPDDNPPPAPAPPRPEFKNPEGAPNYSLKIEVPEVTVDVGVLLEKTHQFVPGLKPSNFRVLTFSQSS